MFLICTLKSITINITCASLTLLIKQSYAKDIISRNWSQSMKHVGLFHNQVLLLHIFGVHPRIGDEGNAAYSVHIEYKRYSCDGIMG